MPPSQNARRMTMPLIVCLLTFFAAPLFAAQAPPLHRGYYTWPDLHGNTLVFT